MARTTQTKTISLDPEVIRKAEDLAKRRGFKNSFSAYVALLIDRDDEQIKKEEGLNGHAEVVANK